MSQQKLKVRLIGGRYYPYLQNSLSTGEFLTDENGDYIVDGNGDFIVGVSLIYKGLLKSFNDAPTPAPAGAEWDTGMLEYEGQS